MKEDPELLKIVANEYLKEIFMRNLDLSKIFDEENPYGWEYLDPTESEEAREKKEKRRSKINNLLDGTTE